MKNSKPPVIYKILSLFLAFFIISVPAIAQEGALKGTVLDPGKKPLAGITVSLLKDSITIRSASTDADGKFILTGIKYGSYNVLMTGIGYSRIQNNIIVNDQVTTGEYTMKQETNLMKNISVTARKPFIEQRIDRTVVNVDALISNAGVSALDVLENTPGVLVSSDGAISLKGKSGVIIFIDDKPTYLSGADLANYLRSMPSGTLDRIEIMPNPPARYDAAGNAGIINIRTKKSRASGFNGGMNLNFGQGKYSRTNNSFNFNYRNRKINFFGIASYSMNNSFNDLDIYRYYLNGDKSLRSTFFQNSYIRRTGYSTNVKMGVDYFLTPKTTIGILFNGASRPSREKTFNKSIVANSTGAVDSFITADNKQRSKWKNGSVNFNFLHRYTPEEELSFDLDYVVYTSNQDQDFLNGIFSSTGNLKTTDGLTGNLPTDLKIYSARGDYSHSISANTKLGAGAKVSYVNTDNAANYFTLINNTRNPDYDKTNHFLYKETINAGYLNLNKDWKHLSLQAGIRIENTISNGHQLGNVTKPDSTFKRSYTNLFPTAFLLYKLDTLSNNQLRISYGRRIDRPFYQDLNPFISPLDKFSIYVGNPYLQPSFTNTYELSHIYKNKITTTFSFNTTKDIVQETIDLSNSVYVSRPANIGKSSVIGLSISGSVKPAKWWTANLNADGQNRYYKGILYEYLLDTSSLYLGVNMTNQFVLGKNWTAEISGSYRTGVLVGQIISLQTGGLNAAIAKKIFKNKGSVKLNVRDIFYTRLNHGIITSIKNAYATYHNWGDTRNATISFTYNFGKNTSTPRNRNSGAETEQNRVK